MKLPSEKQARGYDILVWIDEDGDVVARSYSEGGAVFLTSLDPRYRHGDILELMVSPEDFTKHVPPKLKVGMCSTTSNKVHRMDTPHLQ